MTPAPRTPPALTDLAFLADTHTAALVGPDGAVEWFCAPRFDSPSVCARILDSGEGGHLTVTVEGVTGTERAYRGESLVLESTLVAPTGTATLVDVLAVVPGVVGDDVDASHVLVRLLRCTAGRVTASAEVDLRPDYARSAASWARGDDGWDLKGTGLRLVGTLALEEDAEGVLRGRQELEAGDAVVLGVRYHEESGPLDVAAAERMVEESERAWAQWAGPCGYDGFAAEAVRRSAIVLRGLAFDETGALVAAPTTSLPEWPGGERNWDYRYTWHRDASLHVLALFRLGHSGAGRRYLDFLLSPDVVGGEILKPMATIDGTHDLDETELEHLSGYRDSRPVRIGNEAYTQVQWDTYGHVLDAAFVYHRITGDLGAQRWAVLRGLVDVACERWQEPDSGLWEVRSGARRHSYSTLMLWVCVDRGIHLAEALDPDAVCLDRWREAREAIRADLLAHGYDEEVGSFVAAFGTTELDASMLRVPLVGFLPGDDPRVVSTIDVISAALGDGEALVHRYDTEKTDDGLEGPEGAFLLCSFDLVSALVLAGRREEAEKRFHWIVARSGPFGLLPEEMTSDGTALGNYPQAFSHLSLIEAALNLDESAQDGRDALHAWGREGGS